MQGVARIALATIIAGSGVAAADPTYLGLFFGPRVFSDDAKLGEVGDVRGKPHASLNNGIEFGIRVARPFLPWLVPELELGLAPTGTDVVPGMGGLDEPATSVFWIDPRAQLRFELLPGRRFQPFLVVGGGSPIPLSSARKTFKSEITGDGYVGGGMRFDTGKRFAVRFDARVSLQTGIERYIAAELDFSIGLELHLGEHVRHTTTEKLPEGELADRDHDGIPDAKDLCPDREEDADGFEDLDGCPDIDNDLDKVLDIADRCPNVPETYNGYEDDDGCPDTVPLEVDNLRGTVEGLLYAEGETVVRDSALPNIQKIAKIMTAHPSIRVVLIGYTDSTEANQFADTKPGAPPADLEALAMDLSRARAEAVKQALVAAGIAATRVNVDGRGAEEPVADNDKAKGKLANRRVEIRLYVAPH